MQASLKLVKGSGLPATAAGRFVLVVSAKVARLAVTRNKLKRRARHIIRRHQASSPKHYDTFIFFTKGAAELSFPELEQQLVFLLKRAKII
ncbi:MAG: ribonuclease P protein component [Candidatus Vogelbacteria bacterium]|nr:ribonuclease P protein component [Candidatus Vogelbacteria bacterium]